MIKVGNEVNMTFLGELSNDDKMKDNVKIKLSIENHNKIFHIPPFFKNKIKLSLEF